MIYRMTGKEESCICAVSTFFSTVKIGGLLGGQKNLPVGWVRPINWGLATPVQCFVNMWRPKEETKTKNRFPFFLPPPPLHISISFLLPTCFNRNHANKGNNYSRVTQWSSGYQSIIQMSGTQQHPPPQRRNFYPHPVHHYSLLFHTTKLRRPTLLSDYILSNYSIPALHKTSLNTSTILQHTILMSYIHTHHTNMAYPLITRYHHPKPTKHWTETQLTYKCEHVWNHTSFNLQVQRSITIQQETEKASS